MNRAPLVAGLCLLSTAPAFAGPQTEPAADAVAEAPRRTPDEINAARAAVADVDLRRVMRDDAYATQFLGHLDLLAADANTYSALTRNIETLRLYPLVALERADEVREALDRLFALRPDQSGHYAPLFMAAISIRDYGRFATAVETASHSVRGAGWNDLRSSLERDLVWSVLHQLRREDRPAHTRLAGALFRIGWTGGYDGARDSLRMILVEDALGRGNREEARSFASAITSPSTLMPLLVLKRYDGLLPEHRDGLDLLREALAAQDRRTAEDLARDGQNLTYRLDRVQHLRALGRNADALALVRPLLEDANASALRSEDGMWLVNEAAYALLDLGRGDEAAGLMRGLATLPVDEHAYLISSIINQGQVLNEAGRHAEALAHARRLERELAQHASDYGVMWIRAIMVCALTSLDRAGDATATIMAMRATQDANVPAMTRAFLCLNDLDSAERLIISRLEGDDPKEVVMALQNYALEPRRDPMIARLLAVRARPAVSAALDRVARVVELPLARTYWGGF